MWRHLVCRKIKSFNLFAKIVILPIFKFILNILTRLVIKLKCTRSLFLKVSKIYALYFIFKR